MAEASSGQDGRVPPGAQVGKGLMAAHRLGGKPHLCHVRALWVTVQMTTLRSGQSPVGAPGDGVQASLHVTWLCTPEPAPPSGESEQPGVLRWG